MQSAGTRDRTPASGTGALAGCLARALSDLPALRPPDRNGEQTGRTAASNGSATAMAGNDPASPSWGLCQLSYCRSRPRQRSGLEPANRWV